MQPELPHYPMFTELRFGKHPSGHFPSDLTMTDWFWRNAQSPQLPIDGAVAGCIINC
jgi:hypothetical protein